MSEYSGLKIDKEIIIVEKKSKYYKFPQGYFVTVGNKKQLQTASAWAGDSAKVHTYANGTFTFELDSSADNSSQGGKLSFWNCKFTADDGNTYLIGVNADCLLSFLTSSTFINGVCQEKVWIGRNSGYTGVYTENMEEFKQAIEDEKSRQTAKKTSDKYEIGTILGGVEPTSVYLGCYNSFISITEDANTSKLYTIKILKTPIKKYIYSSQWNDNLKATPKENDFYLYENLLEPVTSYYSYAAYKFSYILDKKKKSHIHGSIKLTPEIADKALIYVLDKYKSTNESADNYAKDITKTALIRDEHLSDENYQKLKALLESLQHYYEKNYCWSSYRRTRIIIEEE